MAFVARALQLDTFKNQVKNCAINDSTFLAINERNVAIKGALLKSFVEQPKTILIPTQELDPIASPIEEDEDITGKRIIAKAIANNATKPVK